jgi:hypothetical protein
MREMFMGPRNVFRVKEALLSVLAGDVFGKTPIWSSVRIFKAIYYLGSLFNLRRTLYAARMRKLNIRPADDVTPASR